MIKDNKVKYIIVNEDITIETLAQEMIKEHDEEYIVKVKTRFLGLLAVLIKVWLIIFSNIFFIQFFKSFVMNNFSLSQK